ncbi:DNA-dependent RNA polymerase II, partial [Marasmius sp. AFHP31]
DADKPRINQDLWPHEGSGYCIGLLPSLDGQAETTSAEAKRVRAPVYNTQRSGGDSSGLEGFGEEVLRLGEVFGRTWNSRNEPVRTFEQLVIFYFSPRSSPHSLGTLKSTSWIHTSRLPACGLVKNLALLSCIFVKSHFAPVIEWMSGVGLESLEENAHSLTPCTKVFANGVWKDAGCSKERAVVIYRPGTGLQAVVQFGDQQSLLRKKHIRWIARIQR